MAREVLGVTGAVIGGIYGGPTGARIGFAVGSIIGGVIDGPDTVRGPGLGEAPIQTSRDGIPIPKIWGKHHCHGNIIQYNPIQEIEQSESQGKGSSQEVISTRRLRTFGIGVCKGPITQVCRIWENDKLVYDVRDTPALPVEETNAYAANIRIYLGDEAQLPDPDLEAHVGVGNCPAYRGLVYIVWVNYDITDFGSAIPQYRFEVDTVAGIQSTSHPYPLITVEGMDSQVGPNAGKVVFFGVEGMDGIVTPGSGLLGGGLVEYSIPPEGMDGVVAPNDGLLGGGLVEYVIPPEGMDGVVTPGDGLLNEGLIDYAIPPEGMDGVVTPNDGTLT